MKKQEILRLADELTKLWHLGPVALYEEMLNQSL